MHNEYLFTLQYCCILLEIKRLIFFRNDLFFFGGGVSNFRCYTFVINNFTFFILCFYFNFYKFKCKTGFLRIFTSIFITIKFVEFNFSFNLTLSFSNIGYNCILSHDQLIINYSEQKQEIFFFIIWLELISSVIINLW